MTFIDDIKQLVIEIRELEEKNAKLRKEMAGNVQTVECAIDILKKIKEHISDDVDNDGAVYYGLTDVSTVHKIMADAFKILRSVQ